MKAYKAEGSFPGSFEVRIRGPFDDRGIVNLISDLTDKETWLGDDGTYYHYRGMPVVCNEDNKLYIYTGDSGNLSDVTSADYWTCVGTANLDSYKTDEVILPDYVKLVVISKEDYDNLEQIDQNTVYYIKSEGNLLNTSGLQGKSAYDIWLEVNDFEKSDFSEEDFIDSLHVDPKEWVGTLKEFDAILSPDPNRTYYITK